MREKRTKETQQKNATDRIVKWLQSPTGQAALEATRQNYPNAASGYGTLLGFTLGQHAQQFSFNTIDNADFDELALLCFGETDRQRIARENGAKGGRKRSKIPSRATIYRDREKERKANEEDR